MSIAEVEALLDAPDIKHPEGMRDSAMMEIMYGAGLRVSELILLRMQDINLEANFVRVIGKGSKERIVPIGSPARRAVQLWIKSGRPFLLKKTSSKFLFCGKGRQTHDPAVFLENHQKIPLQPTLNRTSLRTPCATPLPHIFWKAVRIYGLSNHAGSLRYLHYPDIYPHFKRIFKENASTISSKK